MKNELIYPKKLSKGSHIRVIAPSRSLALISQDVRDIAIAKFKELGIKISFGKNVEHKDRFISSSIEDRLEDLHDAFADKSVDGILTSIGGFNIIELLQYIDYDLIKNNPKVLCGFSDITALSNAILSKTGLITFSGPHFSSFGMEKDFEYTLDYFQKCLMRTDEFDIYPSKQWSDDLWFLDQNKRDFVKNDGYWLFNTQSDIKVEGTIIGGNLDVLTTLKGTDFLPEINKDTILFIESCDERSIESFKRDLQELFLLENVKNVKAIVIGRFQKHNNVDKETLFHILSTQKELKNIPIICNVDFGHTTPIITFPIGSKCEISIRHNNVSITIKKSTI